MKIVSKKTKAGIGKVRKNATDRRPTKVRHGGGVTTRVGRGSLSRTRQGSNATRPSPRGPVRKGERDGN